MAIALKIFGWIFVLGLIGPGIMCLSYYNLSADKLEQVSGTIQKVNLQEDEYGETTKVAIWLEEYPEQQFSTPGKLARKNLAGLAALQAGERIDLHTQQSSLRRLRMIVAVAQAGETPIIDVETGIKFYNRPMYLMITIICWVLALILIYFLVKRPSIPITNINSN